MGREGPKLKGQGKTRDMMRNDSVKKNNEHVVSFKGVEGWVRRVEREGPKLKGQG